MSDRLPMWLVTFRTDVVLRIDTEAMDCLVGHIAWFHEVPGRSPLCAIKDATLFETLVDVSQILFIRAETPSV